MLHHGVVRPEDKLVLLNQPFPEWTIDQCNRIMHHNKADYETARKLAECPLLSASWKDSL